MNQKKGAKYVKSESHAGMVSLPAAFNTNHKNNNAMEVITMESAAFMQLVHLLESMNDKLNNLDGHSNTSEWLTRLEVIQMLNVSARTLQNYRDKGILGFSQVGKRQIYYKRKDVELLLNKNYIKPYGK